MVIHDAERIKHQILLLKKKLIANSAIVAIKGIKVIRAVENFPLTCSFFSDSILMVIPYKYHIYTYTNEWCITSCNNGFSLYWMQSIQVDDDEIKSCSEYLNVEEWIRELND
jgi:hypothetical protein